MSKLTVECPACTADIEPVTVLESLATRETNSATDLVENEDNVALRCPTCEQEVSLQTAQVIVQLSIHDPILKVLNAMRENEGEYGTSGWSESIKDAVEKEQESFQKKQEIQQAAKQLEDKLNE